MSQPLRIRKALAEVKSMDGGVEGHARDEQTRTHGRRDGATAHLSLGVASDAAGIKPGPSTLLTGREYIPANQHTGASGLRSFLDRQIARGLKPREHKDYFSGPNF
jgi:hypothetical protein